MYSARDSAPAMQPTKLPRSARSAGSNPGVAVHPQVLQALAELGIDASDHVPTKLDHEAIAWADVVVATCDDACPVVPGKRYVSWQLPDPKGRPLVAAAPGCC